MQVKHSRSGLLKDIGVIVILGALLLSGAYLLSNSNARAAQESAWTSGAPVLLDEATYRPRGATASLKACTTQSLWIIGVATQQSKCIVENGTVSIDSQFQYIKIGSDRQYYPLNDMSPGTRPVQLYASAASAYISRQGFGFRGHSGFLSIDSDIIQSLTPGVTGSGLRQYTYGYEPDFTLSDSSGQIPIGKAGDVSKNGRWLVVELFGKGFARIDLQNGYKTELFSDMVLPYGDGVVSWAEMAISDDGKYVALADRWVPMTVFEISDECTRQISPDQPLSLDGYQGCPSASLQEAAVAAQYQQHFAIDFDESGHELVLHTGWAEGGLCGNGELGCDVLRTIRAPGYDTSTPRLDYLALGDSYSSGEGDTERDEVTNQKYYREYTDNEEDKSLGRPREKCHISMRSYPYVLSKRMNLGDPVNSVSTRWQTVACSGAEKHDIEYEGIYLGQDKGGDEGNEPRLEGYDETNLQASALNEFIPGRDLQVKFVKEYKPKVITLTMGGNDIGFGDKIKACANPVTLEQTCIFATEEGRPQLLAQIKDQYGELKALYEQLYKASGDKSKVYVIGYPLFISEEKTAACGRNIGALNSDEIKMIYNATELMNKVIMQASLAAGVKYIDIEGSLLGGKLCDGNQDFMTGVTGIFGWNSNQEQESFHPNAKGHYQIAMKVWEQVGNVSLLDYDVCPGVNSNICADNSATKEDIEIPSYFQVSELGYTIKYASDLTSGDAVKGMLIKLMRTPYSFSPGSPVQLKLFSDPIDLGQHLVGSDGSLDIDVRIPDTVPAGYHTIVVDGITYSGEPVRYEQVILIRGSDSSDIDENGAPDNQQVCGPFIIASENDDDFDGIDDACDPQIDTPELYRMRFGDSERTYGIYPEDKDSIYVERNTRASSATGVEGDYDPDLDGWAIVGVSKRNQLRGVDVADTATPIGFEVLGEGTETAPYYPVVYAYSKDLTCIAYRPKSLETVLDNESRKLTRARINNQRCYEIL